MYKQLGCQDLALPWHYAGQLNSSCLGFCSLDASQEMFWGEFQSHFWVLITVFDQSSTLSTDVLQCSSCRPNCSLHAKFYVLRPPPELRKLQGREFECEYFGHMLLGEGNKLSIVKWFLHISSTSRCKAPFVRPNPRCQACIATTDSSFVAHWAAYTWKHHIPQTM